MQRPAFTSEENMKRVIGMVILLLLPIPAAQSQSTKPTTAAELAFYQGADRERILFDGAKREGKLVWYTTLATDQNKQIAAAFEKKYPGVSVDTFRTGSSADKPWSSRRSPSWTSGEHCSSSRSLSWSTR